MKTTAPLIASEVLLVLAIVFLFLGWKGSAGIHFGWPLAQCKVSLMGSAEGGWVAMAYLSLLASAATLLTGIVGVLRSAKESA